MDKININEIKGRWEGIDKFGQLSGGDDTIESIKIVAEKVNEFIDFLNFVAEREPETKKLLDDFNNLR